MGATEIGFEVVSNFELESVPTHFFSASSEHFTMYIYIYISYQFYTLYDAVISHNLPEGVEAGKAQQKLFKLYKCIQVECTNTL